MESELCKCGRPAKHRGYCKGSRPKKTVHTTTEADPQVSKPKVIFTVQVETLGQKYEAIGVPPAET